jgi:hypothetical protein
MKEASIRLVAAVVAGATLLACSSERLVNTSGASAVTPAAVSQGCAAGREGCPCVGEGQTTACGNTVSRVGDYVTCANGTSTCRSGAWSACEGAVRRLTRSLSATTLDGRGVHPVSTTWACDPDDGGHPLDLCDPECQLTTSSAADVDAGGFVTVQDAAVALAPTGCRGMQCQVSPSCPSNSPTALTGTVFDPELQYPVANALVYVPVDIHVLPPLGPGPSCNACATEEAVDAVAVTRSGPDGKFTLTNVPSTQIAPGQPVPFVVQTGHWRRVRTFGFVPECTSSVIAGTDTRLPAFGGDGLPGTNMPQIAVATGSDDPIECVLMKIGISPAELTPGLSQNGHVSIYADNGLSLGAGTPAGSMLYGGPTPQLNDFDVVLLPCEGTNQNGVDNAGALDAYLSLGGHVLATHDSYTWLATPNSAGVAQATDPQTMQPNPLYGVADWNVDGGAYAGQLASTPDTTSARTETFTQWLAQVQATSAQGLPVYEAFDDIAAVLEPPSQPWLYSAVPDGGALAFSFDTPLASDAGAAAETCGRLSFSDFHAAGTGSEIADGGPCTSNAQCGYTATCGGTAASPGTCSASGPNLPLACLQFPMSPQERAIEFMLFDLTSCTGAPPVPAAFASYQPATFSEVVTASCTSGEQPLPDGGSFASGNEFVWRKVKWNASIPSSSFITISAQTANAPDDGGTVDWTTVPTIPLATITNDSIEPGYQWLDTGDGGALLTGAPGDAGAAPGSELRLTVTLNPSADGTATPTLDWWQVFYDCVASE